MKKGSLNLMRAPFLVSPTARFVWAAFILLVGLHFILSYTHEPYGHSTSVANFIEQFSIGMTKNRTAVASVSAAFVQEIEYDTPIIVPQSGQANAVILFLARNSDLDGVVSSVRQLEDRFNRIYHYPWVFLNDEPFTEEFKRRVRVLSYSKMEFGLIPSGHWRQPDWIDEDKAREHRNQMVQNNVIYGGSVAYRNMCRFNSGFFYKHELLKPYRYYWRVEPSVKFFCDIDYDPFAFMQENNKTYGFTLSMLEYIETIPTLWNTVKEFIKQNPQYVAEDNSMRFLSDNRGWSYNLCHFWSNFEIADMDFWRGKAYSAFFDYLDSTGGFYYERWGDAPVHSIGAGLFARKDQIHFFNDIGYQHESFGHCPSGDSWSNGRCACDPKESFDYTWGSCLIKWERMQW